MVGGKDEARGATDRSAATESVQRHEVGMDVILDSLESPNRWCLGPVDKVDSQLTAGVIQDCFWGGGFDSRFDDGHGVGVF